MIKKIWKSNEHQVWWYTSVIPAFRRMEQKDQEFKARLGYTARQEREKKRRKTKRNQMNNGTKKKEVPLSPALHLFTHSADIIEHQLCQSPT
jgi:hypothetical protein